MSNHTSYYEPTRKGIQTSEFRGSRITQIVVLGLGLLTATGVLTPDQTASIQTISSEAIMAITTFVVAMVEVFYGISRAITKKGDSEAQSRVAAAELHREMAAEQADIERERMKAGQAKPAAPTVHPSAGVTPPRG
jgi:hypothetical protein